MAFKSSNTDCLDLDARDTTHESGSRHEELASLPPSAATQQRAIEGRAPRGNPAAVTNKVRAAVDEVRIMSRVHTQLAIDTLVACCQSTGGNAMARINAARELLDRGWGRSRPSIEDDVSQPTRIQVVFADMPQATLEAQADAIHKSPNLPRGKSISVIRQEMRNPTIEVITDADPVDADGA